MELREKKDHIINSMPNLSPEEKRNLITHFNTHPEDEGKIDWNKATTLRYQDFVPIINKISKSAKKKAVKINGIQGLTEGEDYVKVFEYGYVGSGGAYSGTVMGYSPLTWEASKMIASTYVGTAKVEGEWCIAYQKDRGYWDQYCADEESIFIMFVDYREGAKSPWGKVAVRVYQTGKYEIWNAADHRIFKSGGEPPYDENYPEFFFLEDKMRPIINNARHLIDEAGGVQANQTKNYEVMTSVYGEVNEEGILEGSVSFEQMSYTMDGDDYDTEDGGDESTYAEFYITKVGVGTSGKVPSDFTYDFKNFNCQNGIGIYIEYVNDQTPDDAYKNASNKWEGEINSYPDMYDIKREFKVLMGGDTELDYIIINNYNEIDDYLKDVIEDEYFTFYDRSDRNYGYRGAKTKFDTVEEDDLDGNHYQIIVRDEYNYTKKGNNDWVSLPSQRNRDRQLDLPFGL